MSLEKRMTKQCSSCGGICKPSGCELENVTKTWMNSCKWQGLTDEELNQIYAEPQTHAGQYARAIEAKLKEKNA